MKIRYIAASICFAAAFALWIHGPFFEATADFWFGILAGITAFFAFLLGLWLTIRVVRNALKD